MRILALLCLATAMQVGIVCAQPSTSNNDPFCSNINFVAANFKNVDKIKGPLLRTEEYELFGSMEIYATKIELEGFEGNWFNDLMLGLCCQYDSKQTYAEQERVKEVEKLKQKLETCLGSQYRLRDGEGISFASTVEGDDYYNYPEISIGWNDLESPGNFKIVLSFMEPLF